MKMYDITNVENIILLTWYKTLVQFSNNQFLKEGVRSKGPNPSR